MSNILNNAKKHFTDRLAGDMDFVEVPEWSEDKDNPEKIYFKPMTLAQQDKIFKYVNDGSLRSIAETIIIRSLDEDGKRIFRPGNMTEFMRMIDPKVMERIARAMAGDDEEDEDGDKGPEKN